MQAWSIWKWSLKRVCNQKTSFSITDGRPLSLEEVWSNVHPNYRQRLQQGPWDTLTQQVTCVTSCICWRVFMLFWGVTLVKAADGMHTNYQKWFIDCRRRIALLQEAVAFSKSTIRCDGSALQFLSFKMHRFAQMVYKVPEFLISDISILKENNI